MIDESKNVQTTPTCTYCKRNRPLPYCNQNCRTPRHWKFTQHHRTTRPPPNDIRRVICLSSARYRPDRNSAYMKKHSISCRIGCFIFAVFIQELLYKNLAITEKLETGSKSQAFQKEAEQYYSQTSVYFHRITIHARTVNSQ